MRKFLITGLCALLLAGPAAGGVENGACPAVPAQGVAPADPLMTRAVDMLFNGAVRSGMGTGYAVAVADDTGRILFARAYGQADLENPTPVRPDNIFRVGSVTKEFTAAAILLLADQGKLSIDDPVSNYIDKFSDTKITLRHMLAHTSGLRNYTNAEFRLKDGRLERSVPEMVAYILAQPDLLTFPPGSRYSYSNSGYFLLGAVIEKVTGQGYADFIRTALLDPLGLTHTAIDTDGMIVPGLVHGYEKAADAPTGTVNAMIMSLSVAGPAGALRSTVGDLICWNRALIGGRVLSPGNLAQMAQPGLGDYGLGLMIRKDRDGIRSVGHFGAINGFQAALFTLPEQKLTFAVLGNRAQSVIPVVPAFQKAIVTFLGH
ncbi:serine hydrolase [Niveispirillum sp.]|uniref:serine hydrolase domain-containing protein n=1 Tax=Niveispirillum sp. TaxID=1917217 RepID=UPI001B66F2C0|nr:serine hydrolase domain-containing protein [Niveispirillum sp.]MBP7339132.1 beta-lactamase family protein [Niveispirillum sp.]